MRRFVQTITSSDPGIVALVIGLLLIALISALFMRDASPIPPGKQVVTVARGGFKRDREEMREIVTELAQVHPELYVKVIRTNVDRKIDTMIAAGVPPDVVHVGVDLANYYIESDALADLMPYVEADPELRRLFGRTLFPDADEPGVFSEEMVRSFVREEGGRKRLYAFPISINPFVLFYNRDLFDKYGVAYPDENWSWDDLREKAIALTRDREGRRADHPAFDPQQCVSFGFQFAGWQHGYENFIRQAGGRLISDDGGRVVADDPRTVAALQFLFDLRYRDRVVPSPQSATAGGVGFAKGNIAMQLYGVFLIATLKSTAPDLDWDLAPPPRGPDGLRSAVVYTNAYGIARDAANKEGALKYLKFMLSERGADIVNRNGIFIPARRDQIAAGLAARQEERRRNWSALTHAVEHGYGCAPFSTRQFYGDVYDLINTSLGDLMRGDPPLTTPRAAAERIALEGNRILQRDAPVSRARAFGIVALIVGALPALWVLWRLLRRRRVPLSAIARHEERWGYALISPWIIGFLVFSAFPILVSLALSLARWQSLSGFSQVEFVGTQNYWTAFSGQDRQFWSSLGVTIRYALFSVPLGLILGLALALLMNQKVRGIAGFRTLFYIPAVLPSVAVAVLWWHLFHRDFGWINRVLAAIDPRTWFGGVAGGPPVDWLGDERVVLYVFVIMSLWAVGGGMIIYLAGLQSIPTELYEAAELDGAGRGRRIWHVTLPMLSPVIFFNLIMGIIGSFQVFSVAFVLYDGGTGPGDSALFYGLHLFREAFVKYRLGYASSLAWILFAIILLLTALVFKSSPMWVHYEAARRKPA